ncbi:MAG TPA: hypothetical protein VM013_09120, partial [Dehalococcoidia bacterium]|nr:hypothetical protein [Dehalococcoidia bacterium]
NDMKRTILAMTLLALAALLALSVCVSCGRFNLAGDPPRSPEGIGRSSPDDIGIPMNIGIKAVDETLPDMVKLVGAILGLPVLIGAGAVWGRVKPARRFANLVGAVQVGRETLNVLGAKKMLGAFDGALVQASALDTVLAVKTVKRKRKIKSVTKTKGA